MGTMIIRFRKYCILLIFMFFFKLITREDILTSMTNNKLFETYETNSNIINICNLFPPNISRDYQFVSKTIRMTFISIF